jgi:hypothetical protein
MKTASWRAVHGRIDRADRSEDRSYRRAGPWTVARETWRFHAGALAPLLAITLSVLMVGATAVCGLAVVSRWGPPSRMLTTDEPMRGDREAGAGSPEGATCLSRAGDVDHLEPCKDIRHDAGGGG